MIEAPCGSEFIRDERCRNGGLFVEASQMNLLPQSALQSPREAVSGVPCGSEFIRDERCRNAGLFAAASQLHQRSQCGLQSSREAMNEVAHRFAERESFEGSASGGGLAGPGGCFDPFEEA